MPSNKTYDFDLIEIEINEIVNLFYRQKEDEGFTELNKLWDKIEEFINYLNSDKLESRKVEATAGINEILVRLLSAIEKKDIIIITDILKYELLNYFDNL